MDVVTIRLRMRKLADAYGGTQWWCISHIVDWVLCFALLFAAGFLSAGLLRPYHRTLQQPDPYDLPLLEDTVPSWMLAPIVLSPLAVIFATQYSLKSLHDLHHGMLGWLESLSLNFLATQSAKLLAGRYRPSWTNDRTLDGRQSFPSGHSSISFAAMVYLSLYASAKLGLYSKHGGHLWKFLLTGAPIVVASLVAISRTRDYRHHFSDVLAGAILGTALATAAYLLNYPPPWSSRAMNPKCRNPPAIAASASIVDQSAPLRSNSTLSLSVEEP